MQDWEEVWESEEAAPFAAQVASALKDTHWKVRKAAAEALGMMGPEAAPHAAQVAVLLKDTDEWVREAAGKALRNMGPEAAPFAPQVAALLKDGNGDVRGWAADTLGKMGPEAAPYAAEVAALLKPKPNPFNRQVRMAAAELANRSRLLLVFFLLHQPIRRCIDEANIHYALLYCLNHLLLCSSSLVKKLAKHKFGLVLHSKTSLPVSDEFGIHLGIVRIEEWFDPVRDWIVWMKDVKDALATRE